MITLIICRPKKDGQPLSQVISRKTDDILQKLQALPQPLEDNLSQAEVNEVYERLKELLVLVKVDMTSALAVTLTFRIMMEIKSEQAAARYEITKS